MHHNYIDRRIGRYNPTIINSGQQPAHTWLYMQVIFMPVETNANNSILSLMQDQKKVREHNCSEAVQGYRRRVSLVMWSQDGCSKWLNQQGACHVKSDCSSSGDLRLATHSNCNGTQFITRLQNQQTVTRRIFVISLASCYSASFWVGCQELKQRIRDFVPLAVCTSHEWI